MTLDLLISEICSILYGNMVEVKLLISESNTKVDVLADFYEENQEKPVQTVIKNWFRRKILALNSVA
jgi:hypothetical protein